MLGKLLWSTLRSAPLVRVLACAVALAAAPSRAATIFVAPVPGTDDASQALTRAVETAVLKRVVEADVVTPRALDAKLEVDLVKACTGDGDDAACVVDFAQGMGVEYVLRTTLGRLGDEHILTMSLYNAKRAALVGQGQRHAGKAADLVAEAGDLVAEVARTGGLRVVVDHRGAAPYLAYSEIGGGALLLLASAGTHAAAFLVIEPDYEQARLDRSSAQTWELARPFAYGVPVAGYLGGAVLVGLGIYSLAQESP